MTLSFSSSLPENLRPHEGDVLVDFDIESLFGGKVNTVISAASGITIVCGHLESVHDIFEQYVTVEQYGKDDDGNLVRRRVAGIPELNVGEFSSKTRRKSEGSDEFNLFNFGLSGHYPVYTSPGGDVNISIDADINFAIDMKAVWDFPMFGPDYLSVTTTMNNDIGLGFTLDGKVKDIYPLGLVPGGGMPIPANCPLFIITFGPDVFIGGDYHAKLNFQTPKFKGKLWGKMELAGDFTSPKFRFGYGIPPGEQAPDPAKEAENNNWSGSIEFNGYEQCGVMTHFSFGASKLLSWALKTNVEFTTYVGPKVSGALNLSLSNVMQDQFSAYNLLKDSKPTFSPLGPSYEAKVTMKTLFTEAREWTLADGSYNLLGDFDLYLLPDFEVNSLASKASSTGGYLISANIKPQRNILWPLEVGLGVYKHNQLYGINYVLRDDTGKQLPSYSQFSKEWTKVNEDDGGNVTYHISEGGKYEVRPFIRVGSVEFPASPSKEVEVEGPYIDILPRNITIDSSGGKQTIELYTNCENMSVNVVQGLGKQHFQIETDSNRCTMAANPLHGMLIRSVDFRLKGMYLNKATGKTWEVESLNAHAEQHPDGQLNRWQFMDKYGDEFGNNGNICPFLCSSSPNGGGYAITGHKEPQTVDKYPPLPVDGYDLNVEIYDGNKIRGTARWISGWQRRNHKHYREESEISFNNAHLATDGYYDNGYSLASGSFTITTKCTYVESDPSAETESYIVVDEQTTTTDEYNTSVLRFLYRDE